MTDTNNQSSSFVDNNNDTAISTRFKFGFKWPSKIKDWLWLIFLIPLLFLSFYIGGLYLVGQNPLEPMSQSTFNMNFVCLNFIFLGGFMRYLIEFSNTKSLYAMGWVLVNLGGLTYSILGISPLYEIGLLFALSLFLVASGCLLNIIDLVIVRDTILE